MGDCDKATKKKDTWSMLNKGCIFFGLQVDGPDIIEGVGTFNPGGGLINGSLRYFLLGYCL